MHRDEKEQERRIHWRVVKAFIIEGQTPCIGEQSSNAWFAQGFPTVVLETCIGHLKTEEWSITNRDPDSLLHQIN